MTPEQELRSICQDRCAEFGDPPCYELDKRSDVPWIPCSECLVEAGEPTPLESLDPQAVIRNLI